MESIQKILKENILSFNPQALEVLDDDLILAFSSSHTKSNVLRSETEQQLAQPFRVNYLAFILCEKGTITYSIDMQKYSLRQGDILVILPHSIGQTGSFSDDLQLCVLGVARGNLPTEIGLSDVISYSADIYGNPLIHLIDNEIQTIHSMFQLMKETKNMPSVLHYLLASFYTYLGTAISSKQAKAEKFSHPQRITKDFLVLLGKHFAKEHKIAFYADKMCITVKHLSETVKEVSGITAKQWIQNRLLLEAKVMLLSDNYSVWQVSELLGFSNESFFGTFFQKQTGVSPAKFAREHK